MSITLRKIACIWGICISLLILPAGCSQKPKPSTLETAKGVFNDLRTGVRDEIKDPAKAAEVAVLVDQFEHLVIEGNEARTAHEAALRSLSANYDATEEDFKAVFREFNAKKKTRQGRIVAILMKARALTTAEEWKALAKVKSHALEQSVRAEQGM